MTQQRIGRGRHPYSTSRSSLPLSPRPLPRSRDVEKCGRLFVIDTTLAAYSAFSNLNTLLSRGPTRADELPGIEKVDGRSGGVLPEVVRTLL